ncbi:hypothetical protein DFQ26_000574 [Actinomortierella ambigua]|nr:hypothetical protein DFQ26_000574 [Actinomortierella ambigua]
MFARVSLSQAARLCSQQSRNFASSAAHAASHHTRHQQPPRRYDHHPLFKNVSPQFFTANKFQPAYTNNLFEAQQNALRARYQLRGFHSDRSKAATTGTTATATTATGATRGFCGGRAGRDGGPWHEHMERHWQKWNRHHMRWYDHHVHHKYHHSHHHSHGYRRRGPFRFLMKAIMYSTAIIAIPAIVVFGASTALPILFVPIAVGGALFFAGSLVFLVLPVVLIGGAVTFFAFSMPAAMAMKDVNKILKRDNGHGSGGNDGDDYDYMNGGAGHWSALGTLGKDWEIQPAGEDEYFHWSFPTNRQPLDKVEIRLAVFDPEDSSRRKHKALKWFDRLAEGINEEAPCGSTDCHHRDHHHRRHYRKGDDDDSDNGNDNNNNNSNNNSGKTTSLSRKSHFQYRQSMWEDYEGPKDMTLRRDGNHVEIQFEDDGAKVMKTKIAKKYLRLGQIVDRAASEVEAREGRKLGDQVVLVRKVAARDSCWWWTPYGEISLRIPFSRQWVRDLSDE